MCCGEAQCKINIHVLQLQNLTYNDSNPAMYVNSEDSDDSEEFDDDSDDGSAEDSDDDSSSSKEFDKHLNIDKHFSDFANDFAKHFDSQSAVIVASTFVHSTMGEWTNQGNEKFHNSNIIPASP